MRTTPATLARSTTLTLLLSLATFSAACDSIDPTENRDVPAALVSAADTAEIVVPANASAGQEFTISVGTFTGCASKVAFTRVAVQDHNIEIRPYNHNESSDCTGNTGTVTHTAKVTVLEPGTATIRIVGAGPNTIEGQPQLITIYRTVIVQ